MHLIWISLFVPGMLFVVWAFPQSRNPNIWLLSFTIAIIGLAILVGNDLIGFFSQGGQLKHGFMRAIFAVVMSIEVPCIALAIGSVSNWILSKGDRQSARDGEISNPSNGEQTADAV